MEIPVPITIVMQGLPLFTFKFRLVNTLRVIEDRVVNKKT